MRPPESLFCEAGGSWTIEIVDEAYGQVPGLHLGAMGGVHIAYGSDGEVRYAHREDAGGWTIETIALANPEVITLVSAAADSAGGQHVLYSAPSGPVRYANHTTGPWTFEDLTSDADEFAALAVTPAGEVHAIFMPFTDSDRLLTYARRFSDGWMLEEIGPSSSSAVALAVEEAGAVHIGHRNMYGEITHEYREPSGGWTPEMVPVESGQQNMAVDGAGGVHFSYVGSSGGIDYSYRAKGSSWTTEMIDPLQEWVLSSPMTTDPADGPHVGYLFIRDNWEGSVRYACRLPDGSWLIETVELVEFLGPGDGLSIIVDDDGVVHVAYSFDSTLKYARKVP